MTFDEVLAALHGMLGQPVHVGISPFGEAKKLVGGFAGVPERGESNDIWSTVPLDEQIMFVVGNNEPGRGAYFVLSAAEFNDAAWVIVPNGRELGACRVRTLHHARRGGSHRWVPIPSSGLRENAASLRREACARSFR